nr:immunoglobulin light chain junction region [Macaca mulatta]
CMQRVEYPYSF